MPFIIVWNVTFIRFTILQFCLFLTLGAHAQRGLRVCQFVCLFVYIRSGTTGYETAHERYERLKRNKGSKKNVADFAKRTVFKS